jgi:hypothetical protein
VPRPSRRAPPARHVAARPASASCSESCDEPGRRPVYLEGRTVSQP